ncbi:MAG: RloB domain-containing protein [Treponema sp.]|nr:RloB domain-containing protein [Treponema sp.]
MPRKIKKTPLKRTILLVVEGETEKIYFERLKGFERYSSLKIEPKLPKHSDLTTLVEFAKKEKRSGVYDFVWLVFDRDVLLTQNIPKTTLELINNPERLEEQGINLADSLPCFEIWFLLHFCIPKQNYKNQDEVIKELCKFLPTYSKNNDWLSKNNIYLTLKEKINVAFSNSSMLRMRNSSSQTSNFSMCNVDLLIKSINELDGANGGLHKTRTNLVQSNGMAF